MASNTLGHSRLFERKAGDVRPENVLIGLEGEVRLFNRHSLPDEPVNYIKALENSEVTYLGENSLLI
jgi:hypothetical protein